MRLGELVQFQWSNAPASYSGAAATAEYFSLKNYDHITFIVQTGAWAGGTAAVTINQATAVAGTGAKALAFDWVWVDGVKTAVTSNTFNLAAANKLYVIEVDAASLDTNNGFDCLGLAIASPGANADFYGVTAILSGARDMGASPAASITD
jgi:hypothetical protein